MIYFVTTFKLVISRISILSYHRTYIPLFKILVKPIHDMALSGKFEWTHKHQLAWKATLLVASLGFENHVIEPDAPMFVATDASQIAISYVIFQIIAGEIKLPDVEGFARVPATQIVDGRYDMIHSGESDLSLLATVNV